MRNMVFISGSLKIWQWAVFVVLCCAAFSWGQDPELERLVADMAWQGEVMRNQYDRMTPPGVALDQVLAPEALDLADCEPFSLELDAASLETLVVDDADVVCGTVDTGIGRESAARVVLWVEPGAGEGEDFEGGGARRGAEGGPRSGEDGGESDGFRVCAAGPDTNGVVFLTLTNGGTYAEAEVFAYTMTGQPVVVTNVWTNDANVVVTNVNTVWTNRSPSFRGVLGDWHWLGRVGLTNGVGVFADTMGYCDLVRFYRPVLVADSDDDGLTDGVERLVIGTDPHDPDSDGDGWSDGEEETAGTSPTNRLSAPTLARGVLLHAVRYNTAASNQFVQLYNAGRYPVRLDGFALEVAGAAYVKKFVFPLDTVLTQGHYLLLGGNGVTNADFAMVPDLPMSYSDVPTAAVRLVGPTGTTNSPVDVLMYGTHVPFNEQGLPTDGWLSTNTDLWAGPDYYLTRAVLGEDTDTRVDWMYAEVPAVLVSAPDHPDSDGDTIPDEEECIQGTHPGLADTDGDGLEDDFEVAHGLNPAESDTDDDGVDDGDEIDPESGKTFADLQLGDGVEVAVEASRGDWEMGESIGWGGMLDFTLTEVDGAGLWCVIRENARVPEAFTWSVENAIVSCVVQQVTPFGFQIVRVLLAPPTTNGFVAPVVFHVEDASLGKVSNPSDRGADIWARFTAVRLDIVIDSVGGIEPTCIADRSVHTLVPRSPVWLWAKRIPGLPGSIVLEWNQNAIELLDETQTTALSSCVLSFADGPTTNLWIAGLQPTNTLLAWRPDCATNIVARRPVDVFRMTFHTPSGSPVNEPDNDGAGQNEFTFSDTTPALLTLGLKAKIEPPGVRSDLVADCVFSVTDISGTTFAWGEDNEDGSATCWEEGVEAAATCTGLPPLNDDFGRKWACLAWKQIPMTSNAFEVFFFKNAVQHPGGVPNWFYYWRQLTGGNLAYEGQSNSDCGVVKAMLNWNYGTLPDKTRITIYDDASGIDTFYNENIPRSGIDLFAATVCHESCHVSQIARADPLVPSEGNDSFKNGWSWNQDTHNHWSRGADGEWGIADWDDDGNNWADDAAPQPPFEPGHGDDVLLEWPTAPDWPQAWPIPTASGGPSPMENEAINMTAPLYPEHGLKSLDWGNPGKQHDQNEEWWN